MSEYCLICECEPVDMRGWINYIDNDMNINEMVCPWCINDLIKKRLKQ